MSTFTYPNIGTMPSRALALFLQGKELTNLDFLRLANTYCLSDAVHRLNRAGWGVSSFRETVLTGDPTKRNASVSRYSLPQDVISAAGEDGREYVRLVQEWERKRALGMAGAGESAPADKAAGTKVKRTDEAKHSMGVAR